jgi:hypothetical protein
MTRRHDILALGNAIVDLIAVTDDDFLAKHKLHKGAMALIDETQAEKLYAAMGPVTIVSGGSAANTAVGAAMLGAKTGFIGKVKTDETGGLFTHDIRAVGVAFASRPATDGPATARSFIFVTPDGERTMNTYLGACQNLTEADIAADEVQAAKILYLEGYLWDPPAAKKASVKAAGLAHAAGRRVAMTLSDSFCVDRYRAEFLDLIRRRRRRRHRLRQRERTAFALPDRRFRHRGRGLPPGRRARRRCTRSAKGSIVVTPSRRRTLVSAPFPSSAWSTRPAPAICSPPASSPASPAASRIEHVRPARRDGRRRDHPAHRRPARGQSEGGDGGRETAWDSDQSLRRATSSMRWLAPLGQRQAGARARRQHVLVQICEIDARPDAFGRGHRLFFAQFGIFAEIGPRIAESRFAQPHEAGDIPFFPATPLRRADRPKSRNSRKRPARPRHPSDGGRDCSTLSPRRSGCPDGRRRRARPPPRHRRDANRAAP